MKKPLLIGLVGVVGLLVIVLLALPYITNLTTVRNTITATASATLQHPVSIGRVGLTAIPRPGLQIEGLAITERDGIPIVQVKTVLVEVEPWPLLEGRVVVARILVVRPRLSLLRNADASVNLPLPVSAPPSQTAGEGASRPLDLFLDDVRMEDGELTIRERHQQHEPPLLRLQNVTVTVQDLSVRGKTKNDFNRSVTGTVRMEVVDGVIGKMDWLTQILFLLNLSRKDILIDSLAGTFRFKNGRMTTDDLTLTSPVLDATATGAFNVPDKQMNMVVTTMGLAFDVEGNAAHPTVSLHALKGVQKEDVQKELGGLLEEGLELFRRR